MSITVMWGDHKKSLTFMCTSAWNPTTLKVAVGQAVQLLNTASLPVNIVVDLQAAPISAGEFIVSAQYFKLVNQHPNTRHMLIIGASAETETLCKSHPAFHHFYFTRNSEDGETLLSQLDYLSSVGGLQISAS